MLQRSHVLQFTLLFSVAAMVAALLIMPAPNAWAAEDNISEEADSSQQEEAQEWFRKGNDLRDHDQLQDAIKAYRRAIDLHEEFPEAYNHLGYALRLTGKFKPAVRAYTRALKLRPDYPEAHEYLGKAYLSLGKLNDARKHLMALRKLKSSLADELEEAINNRHSKR